MNSAANGTRLLTSANWSNGSMYKIVLGIGPCLGSTRYQCKGCQEYPVGEIPPGAWTNKICHIKWPYLDDSILEILKDSEKVAE